MSSYTVKIADDLYQRTLSDGSVQVIIRPEPDDPWLFVCEQVDTKEDHRAGLTIHGEPVSSFRSNVVSRAWRDDHPDFPGRIDLSHFHSERWPGPNEQASGS